MASGYALPSAGSYHAHSHSYSSLLQPGRPSQHAPFAKGNGHIRKAPSTGGLYTHAEASRETTPSPNAAVEHHQHYPFPSSHDHNADAFERNGHIHQHVRSHSFSPMKSTRPRGESDLGRPAVPRAAAYKPTLEDVPTGSTSWFSLPEALTALLIPMPYLLASAAYSSTFRTSWESFPPLPAYDRPLPTEGADDAGTNSLAPSGFIEACTLTASTMLLVGVLAKLRSPDRISDRRKDSTRLSLSALREASAWRAMALRALSVGLPFYASMLLGGMRTGLVLLIAVAADLTCTDWKSGFSMHELKQVWSSKVATSVVIILSFISDELGLTIGTSLGDLMLGYLALAMSVLLLQPPLPILAGVSPSGSGYKMTSPTSRTTSGSFRLSAASPLTCSAGDVNLTLFAGMAMGVISVLSSILLGAAPPVSTGTVILGTLAVGSMSAAILFAQPTTLRGESKAGLGLGCFITASCSFMFSPTIWPGTMCNGGLSALSFFGVLYDTTAPSSLGHSHHHDHDEHSHDHSAHTHSHKHAEGGHSMLTRFILARCEPGSLVYSILSEKDSRRIAYFTT